MAGNNNKLSYTLESTTIYCWELFYGQQKKNSKILENNIDLQELKKGFPKT